ncbi:aspartate kinase [[Eubacterium] cellulosolvens]
MTAFSVMAFTSPSINSKTSPRSNHSKVAKSSKMTRWNESSSQISTRTPRRKYSKIIVAKFGGSSLADSERITKAAKSVAKKAKNGFKIVVVVSAIGKTTDTLLEILQNSSGKGFEKHDSDDILSMGERTSARIFSTTLKSEGVKAKCFDPTDSDWPIITDDKFSNANPIIDECESRIKKYVLPILNQRIIPVIGGFIGRTKTGKTSTIGRGGSDTTAFILAKALQADKVILVTDSDGIMTADPKLVSEARRLDQVDCDVLIELADSGKKFIHRKALKYKDPNIDTKVINSLKGNLDTDGTIITGSLSSELEITIASTKPATALTIIGKQLAKKPTIAADLAEKISSRTDLLGLSANSDSIIFYVSENKNSKLLYKELHRITLKHPKAISMTIRRNLAYIRIKGVGLEDTPGVIGKITEVLRKNDINIFGILTITSSILIFVDYDEREKVLHVIRKTLGVN